MSRQPDKLLFGTAGTPKSSKKRSSLGGIKRVKELGLDCMELEFVRGVKMGETTAKEVQTAADKINVALSVHAPYYINLNSAEPEKIDASIERIYKAAKIGHLCGARNIVFHPAYNHKDDSDTVFQRVKTLMTKLSTRLEDESINVILRPETTGKPSQFGDLEETIKLASEIENVLPCIDFSHLYARSCGEKNCYEDFASALGKIEEELGRYALDDMHMHISGIEYGPKGEKNHLNLEVSDMDYTSILQALKDFKVKGLVICESPDNEGDALLLKNTFHAL
jgi:deoxyribonuclease-4